MMTISVNAVILDWAGTTVDFGSRAPTHVFIEIFRERGVDITSEEARGPMGRAKHEHIELILNLPRVSKIWTQIHGAAPTRDDVMAMYADFLPLQKQILAAGSDVIPDVPKAIQSLRKEGIRIGSSTGYTRELMDIVVPIAAAQNYSPDLVVCADEVRAGRPEPWMNLRNAELLNVPVDSVIVVDDTLVGIEAGRNSGMKTVGVSMTGNELGLSLAEVRQLDPEELHTRLQSIEERFLSAGADYVVTSVAELPQLIRRISTSPKGR